MANIKTLEASRTRIISFGVSFMSIKLMRISLFINPQRGGIPDRDKTEEMKFGENFWFGLFIDFMFIFSE